MKAAILIMSDKGAKGLRTDESGPALESWLISKGVSIGEREIIPDDIETISERLSILADSEEFDLILTSGGTGVSPRDVTPEATEKIAERLIPGFGEEMRRRSMEKTPHAVISRALAAIRHNTLIINLPGSPKGAIENIESIWSAVPHAISKIQGNTDDCSDSGSSLHHHKS